MRFSQALNAMLRGHEVAVRSHPGVRYSFDGADGMRIWAHLESAGELHHIDNVPFDLMMRDDWYIVPAKRSGHRESSRQWSVMNRLLHHRLSALDAILIGFASVFAFTPFWYVASIACGIGVAMSMTLEKKWHTDV